MSQSDFEKLFLLEVLVEGVYISTSSLDLDSSVKANLKETCVMFQFLDYPPLVVCEEDFYKSSSPQMNDTQLNFKSGKSCLFSIRSSLVPSLPYKFELKVSVIRKVENPPNKIKLGTSTVDLGDSFSALMHSSAAEPDLPLQKTKAGTFDVVDDKNRKIGNINVFVRLSCFGQLIVTQFQVGTNEEEFLFKGTENKQIVELPGDTTKAPKFEVDPNYRPPLQVRTAKEQVPHNGYGDTQRKPYEYRLQPTEYDEEQAVFYGKGQQMANAQPPQTDDTEGNYKEIVAEIRGHSLHIKIPMKSKQREEEIGLICKKDLRDEIEGPVCKYAPPLNLCDCDFPVPPEAIPRCGPR